MDIRKEEEILRLSEEFREYSKEELDKLSKEEYAIYMRDKRLYDYATRNILQGMEKRRKFYPIIQQALSLNRALIDHQSYKIINDRQIDTGKPVIYAITHVGKFDYQIMTEALAEHTYAFAGDPEEMHRTFDGFFMETSGAIFCDTENSLDRYIAQNTAVSLLKRGTSLMIYPEGIWNITSNLLMLPIFPGVIKMAQEAGVDIVPVAVEQYGKKFIISIEKNIVIDNRDTNDTEYINRKREELRNVMAFAKLDIIKSQPSVTRTSLGEYDDLENEYQQMRLNEWVDKDKKPFYTLEKIEERTFKEKDKNTGEFISSPKDAFSYFKDVKINKNNAFMFRKDFSLPNSTQKYIANKFGEYFNNEESVDEVEQQIRKRK